MDSTAAAGSLVAGLSSRRPAASAVSQRLRQQPAPCLRRQTARKATHGPIGFIRKRVEFISSSRVFVSSPGFMAEAVAAFSTQFGKNQSWIARVAKLSERQNGRNGVGPRQRLISEQVDVQRDAEGGACRRIPEGSLGGKDEMPSRRTCGVGNVWSPSQPTSPLNLSLLLEPVTLAPWRNLAENGGNDGHRLWG